METLEAVYSKNVNLFDKNYNIYYNIVSLEDMLKLKETNKLTLRKEKLDEYIMSQRLMQFELLDQDQDSQQIKSLSRNIPNEITAMNLENTDVVNYFTKFIIIHYLRKLILLHYSK